MIRTTLALMTLIVSAAAAMAQNYTLKDQQVEVAIDVQGNLVSLKNLQTGHDYAGGQPLWRLYFDRKDGEKGKRGGRDWQSARNPADGQSHRTAVYVAEDPRWKRPHQADPDGRIGERSGAVRLGGVERRASHDRP